jgi:hypothetical protein
MSAEHTPTPWYISGKSTIRRGSNDWIGYVHWRNGAANAEFIVRACNAHDNLVAALREARGWLSGWASAEKELAVIDAAISKAEVRS